MAQACLGLAAPQTGPLTTNMQVSSNWASLRSLPTLYSAMLYSVPLSVLPFSIQEALEDCTCLNYDQLLHVSSSLTSLCSSV